MTAQELDQLLASPLLAFMAIGAVISSLIPSLVLKWLMSAIYNIKVSFWILLFVHVLHALIMIVGMAYLGFLDPVVVETLPMVPLLLLSVGSTALKLILLTLFVANEDGDMIAMWRWLMVEIVEFLIYILISLVFLLVKMLILGGIPPQLSQVLN
ncbi:hypothetical protein PGB28_17690 [Primorskyibacter aestuariivivens]|uniref:hypothetical protein n=1 Tax=Primorskyibacter aestuariivivens TaxID=1888912 RepID=UPI002301654B|nr:hypothetical protein [Primorskyibacter aestuariivivens]MDA7430297.1 hypothetical protein [Primorskyibacter aestuariivivens]